MMCCVYNFSFQKRFSASQRFPASGESHDSGGMLPRGQTLNTNAVAVVGGAELVGRRKADSEISSMGWSRVRYLLCFCVHFFVIFFSFLCTCVCFCLCIFCCFSFCISLHFMFICFVCFYLGVFRFYLAFLGQFLYFLMCFFRGGSRPKNRKCFFAFHPFPVCIFVFFLFLLLS